MAEKFIDKMRAAVRISSTSEVITEEIKDCIEACKRDLEISGVKKTDISDPLICRAMKLYCRAEFNYNNKGEQFRESYNLLKLSLCLAGDYNTLSDSDNEKAGDMLE